MAGFREASESGNGALLFGCLLYFVSATWVFYSSNRFDNAAH
jgi:hypothetical protein